MTRINAHINPKLLSDEHLLAEHREIKRVPSLVSKAISRGHVPSIPKDFCLGAGHATFFYDKLSYLYDRYVLLHDECVNRGYNVEDYSSNFLSITDNRFWNAWSGGRESNDLVINRIIERTKSSPKKCFHYYRKSKTKEDIIQLLIK